MSNGGQCLEHYTFIYQINSRPRIYLSLCIRCTADHRVSAIRMSFLNTKWKTWTIHFSNEWNIYTIQRNVATLITVICRIHFILDTKSARGEKMVLSTPHDEFWISWRDIWGKGTWCSYLQAPKSIRSNNTCWPKWPRSTKLTFSSNFDVKNSVKSSY